MSIRKPPSRSRLGSANLQRNAAYQCLPVTVGDAAQDLASEAVHRKRGGIDMLNLRCMDAFLPSSRLIGLVLTMLLLQFTFGL